MDAQTLGAYDRLSADYATEWERQPPPTDLHALVDEYFIPGPTADIGCGAGRDTAWLVAHGFPAIGYDASPGLLAEARRRHPSIAFEQAGLPELEGVAAGAFANVLCETVIMHLPVDLVQPSVTRLVALLERGGTLYLSWRVTDAEDRRDEQGRLYAAFDPARVTDALADTSILHDSEAMSASSGRMIHRIIARASR